MTRRKKKISKGLPAAGDAIARARKLKGMSQEEFADHAKISVRALQRAEAGESKSPEHLQQIAQTLGLGTDFSSLIKLDYNPSVERAPLLFSLLGLIAEYVKKGYPQRFFVDLAQARLVTDGVEKFLMREGSVIIEAELSLPDCRRIFSAFASGRLTNQFNVTSVTFADGRPPLNPTLTEQQATTQHGSEMVVLGRRAGEAIVIGGVRITVISVQAETVRLGIEAPPEVRIDREEVLTARQSQQPTPRVPSRRT